MTPVNIEIPLGLEVPKEPNEIDLLNIEVSVGDAMSQALWTVRDEIIAPRGRSRPVNIQRDETFFMSSVPQHTRPQIQAAVGRALEYAISNSELDNWYKPSKGVAALSGTTIAERIKANRYRYGEYQIPSYDNKGETEAAPVDENAEEEWEEFEYIGPPITLDEAVDAAWEAHVKRYGTQWDPASLGYPGYYGSFDVDGTWCENQLVYISSIEAIGEDGWPTKWWAQGAQFTLVSVNETKSKDGSETSLHFGETPLPTAMDHYVLTVTDMAATEENLVKVQEEAAAADSDYPHTPEIRKQSAARVANASKTIYRLEGGPHVYHLALFKGTETDGLGHSPIRFIVQSQMELGESAGEGTGTESKDGGRSKGDGGGKKGGKPGGKDGGKPGGTGDGRRGGPLGKGAEGEGRLWPTLSGGGEKLVCEAFLGEPPVNQLVVGGKDLEERMRRLATSLDLEYCGYAGKFCINLAKVVGGRAHALGVTSANSTVTTNVDVRVDGSGNNGIVDVSAGEAPEISYLQLLGDLIAQVDYLSGHIVDIYSMPDNRHLIFWDEEKEYKPNWASWALRFNQAFIKAMDDTCMWLFAETCRVVLLQQLRSSNSGITARREKFEETNRAFQDALGILGESVVKLSTLKRAIEWADHYNLTGSARSVLSHKPPPMRFKGETYERPAPIESIPPNIIDLLEGATVFESGDEYVAEYQGRTWTKQELETGVAMRRGMLNRVDPLFLQVPDLDNLYRQFKADPNNARTYLQKLLDEMLKANEEMTKRASAEEKGCFFALEASQYVKSKGRKANGLEYDLQGIHQIADDLIRPHAGGTTFYSRGVNKAIDIKADWDDFISIFSTIGIIALALFCAPLGAAAVAIVTGVAGLALTAYDIAEADRLETLYKSLEDPEAILSWQEVQLARLMANLSIAFSVFDLVGAGKGAKVIVSAAESELKASFKLGVKQVLRDATRAARKTVLENMTKEVLELAVKQALSSTAVVAIMHLLLPKIITPVLVPWMRGVAAAHGTLPEVDAILGPLSSGQPAAPEPIEDDGFDDSIAADTSSAVALEGGEEE